MDTKKSVNNGFDVVGAIAANADRMGYAVIEVNLSLTDTAAVVTCVRNDVYVVWNVFWPDGPASLAFHWGHYDLTRDQAKRQHIEKLYRI